MTFPDKLPAAIDATPPPIMTADEVAAMLGIDLPLQPPLSLQLPLATEAVSAFVRRYTGRQLIRATYTDVWQAGRWVATNDPYWTADFPGRRVFKQRVREWPIFDAKSLKIGGQTADLSRVRIHHVLGDVYLGEVLAPVPPHYAVEFEYEGGYLPIPADLRLAFVELVRRQLLAWGVTVGPGGGTGAAKAITVGALRVDLAVQAAPSEVNSPGFGALASGSLDDFASVLDLYRSARTFASTGA